MNKAQIHLSKRADGETSVTPAAWTVPTRDEWEVAVDCRSPKPRGISDASLDESQRDSGLQPKVARHALPWVNVARNFSNPNGVVAFRRSTVTQPRWGCGNFSRLTQGSRFAPTLGWRTQSRWDCPQYNLNVAATCEPAFQTTAAPN